MSIEKLRTLARELAGEAWDYDRRWLKYCPGKSGALYIQHEDEMFEDPPPRCD